MGSRVGLLDNEPRSSRHGINALGFHRQIIQILMLPQFARTKKTVSVSCELALSCETALHLKAVSSCEVLWEAALSFDVTPSGVAASSCKVASSYKAASIF